MIGIIDCGGANLQSIKSSLDSLNIDSITSNDWSILQNCNGYIIPGVGAAKNVMDTLHIKSLVKRIKTINKPVLGICICLLYTSPSPRDVEESRMPSSA